jgi:pseudouridine-5'-phosphate glycosidase
LRSGSPRRFEPGNVAGAMTDPFLVAEPVRVALSEGRGVVALETSVLAQGLPSPVNLDAMHSMTSAIRDAGAEAAWISIAGGQVLVGTPGDLLERLAADAGTMKVARRDLPMAVAGGGLGATTVSATLWAAHHAGIEVAATGGIGGVHRGTGDVSADLLELARTPGTLICSGPKSIVDPVATMERLEELGIGVIGYRAERLPFFLVTEAEFPLDHVAHDPGDVASAARARAALGIESTLVVCNPIPAGKALPAQEVAEAVRSCEERAVQQGVRGKQVTPFLLSCLAEITEGRSIAANLALLESNARLAGQVATELAQR